MPKTFREAIQWAYPCPDNNATVFFPSAVGILLPIILCLLLCGCFSLWSGMENEEGILYAVEIFQPVVRTGLPGEMLRYLPDFERDTRVPVRRIPVISSNCFTRAITDPATPEESDRVIHFYLDKHGTYVWMQAQRQFNGRELAVAVDGFFRFTFEVSASGTQPGVFEIKGPWQAVELENIASHASRNYQLLHPRVRD